MANRTEMELLSQKILRIKGGAILDNKRFYTAADVAQILCVSKSTAYREIKKLNDKLRELGYITISGKVPKKFFEEKFYC